HLHPGLFEWAPYPTHVNRSGLQHLDLLAGLPGTEQVFESGLAGFMDEAERQTSAAGWQEHIQPFLLYP
ncbi:MAG TPA: hypothetical protein VLD19_12000, partial [Chitinophagaceae bacterium]|nr:hypothetical protein [Chitinophagaceae bacterium]